MKTDKEIMHEIQAGLANEKTLADCLSTVYILINNGDVILSGNVDTEEHREFVKQTVESIPDIKELIDSIRIHDLSKQRHSVEIDWAKGQMDVS